MYLTADPVTTTEARHWTDRKLIALGGLMVLVHVLLLLVVIPKISTVLHPSWNQDVSADGYDYIAANIASGHGYRFYPDTALTVMREPGYPLLLAGLLVVFGNSLLPVKLVNLLLALGTAGVMAKILSRVTSHRWAILAAAGLYLFHPATLVAESRGGVEILFSFLIVLFLLTIYRAIENDRWWAWLISGSVLGLTLLVRSVPILFPLFLLGYFVLFQRRQVSLLNACRRTAIIIVAMFAVLSPWIVRNFRLTGHFIPTASVLGISAHAGQYICSHIAEPKPWWLLDREAARQRTQLATQMGYPFEDGFYYQSFYRTQDEIDFSHILFQRVVSEYERHPGLCLDCLTRNLFNFWFTGKNLLATSANVVVQLPYMVLAAIGAVIGIRTRRGRIVFPMLLLIGYIEAVYIPILAQARYSVPLIPFLSVLGTIALVSGWERFSAGRTLRGAASSGLGKGAAVAIAGSAGESRATRSV